MICTVVTRGTAIAKVILSDEPLPFTVRATLEKAGYRVTDESRLLARVHSVSQAAELLPGLLQRDLFA